jgi:hypothetical protein
LWRVAERPKVAVSGLSALRRPAETADILTTFVVTSSVAPHRVLPGKVNMERPFLG